MKNYLLFIVIALVACGENRGNLQSSEVFQPAADQQTMPFVDFMLDIGNLKGNGDFDFIESDLETSEDVVMIHIQVGAFMIDTANHNTELLRVRFKSDYKEWVSYDDIISPTYSSREECEETSSYCEEFDVIDGESGLVESAEGLVGIKNTYCRHSHDGYKYLVEAWVESLETYPPTIVSKIEAIEIECHSQEVSE